MTRKILILIILCLVVGIFAQAVLGPLFGWMIGPNIFIALFAVLLYQERWLEAMLPGSVILGYFAEVFGVLPAGTGLIGFPLSLGIFYALASAFAFLRSSWVYGIVLTAVWQILWLFYLVFFKKVLQWLSVSEVSLLSSLDLSFFRVILAAVFCVILYLAGILLSSLLVRVLPRKSSGMI